MIRPLSFALVTLAAVAAHAAPITYIEQVHGDLPLFGDPLTTVALDVGLNTVTGTTALGSAGFDFDSFAFTVAPGQRVESLKVVLTDVSENLTAALWDVNAGGRGYNSGSRLDTLDPASPGFDFLDPAALPLGPGDYNISGAATVGIGASAYTFIFDVHAVPEPASLAALAGVAVLGLRRRRRR